MKYRIAPLLSEIFMERTGCIHCLDECPFSVFFFYGFKGAGAYFTRLNLFTEYFFINFADEGRQLFVLFKGKDVKERRFCPEIRNIFYIH